MRLYGAILLALCFVTAGCGDEDASVENPLAPTAVVEAVAQVPAAAQSTTAQSATAQNVSTQDLGNLPSPQSAGHGDWRVTGFTFNNAGPFFSPGSIKLAIVEIHPPSGSSGKYDWSVTPDNCGRFPGDQHRARLHAQANLVFPCGRLKQNKTLYREAGCVSREPRLSDVFFPDDFATWFFPVVGSNRTRRCTVKLDAYLGNRDSPTFSFPTISHTKTITGEELNLDILVNSGSRDPETIKTGQESRIRVEPSGEADPNHFSYWLSDACDGNYVQEGSHDSGVKFERNEIGLWWSKRWTPGRAGSCMIAAEARINDGDRVVAYARATKTVTVGRGAIPDLIVSLSAGRITRTEWGDAYFTLTAVVRNVGTGPSEQTPLYFYQSDSAAPRVAAEKYSPDRVTREWLNGIPKGRELRIPVYMPAPGTGPGQREGLYFSACVAAVHGESDTTNNCSGRGVQPQG